MNKINRLEELFLALEPSWKNQLLSEVSKNYFSHLAYFLEQEWEQQRRVFPPKELIFNAFYKTPFDKVKVVILGQDPYHNQDQAHGLAFSVPEGIPLPPSLRNIFKELQQDLGVKGDKSLNSWAEQGVLLLNRILTVREGAPLSHHKRGWEQFTDAVLAAIAKREKPVVFVLWGNAAQQKLKELEGQIGHRGHLILTAAHPSPLSAHRGFFGSAPFSKINEFLLGVGESPIKWG